MKKNYLPICILLGLLICAGLVVFMAVSARDAADRADPVISEQPQVPEETPVASPSPTATPEPTLEPTPEPTVEPTPEPAPSPEPEVTPIPGPIVTKTPTNETTIQGGTIYFVAKADGATSISWFLASPDGKEGINARDIASKFPQSSCTGTDGEMLGISLVTEAMDGWKVICKFTGPGGDTFTEPAYIYVVGAKGEYLRSLDEVLVLVLNARDPNWTMALGLSYTKNVGRIADYFYESDIKPEEVKNSVQVFTQRLSEEHRAAYKARVDLVVGYYRGIRSDPDGYRGLLSDSGYQAKHYPWDDDHVAACIEALMID